MSATTGENLVKGHIKKWLKTLPNCWFYSASAGPWSVHGVPDIVGCINGRFFGIEVKGPGRVMSATPLQKVQIAAIREAGGVSFIAADVATCADEFAKAGLV